MINKLSLDTNKINESRKYAKSIADEVQDYIDYHSTVAVERTICRLLGIDGVSEEGYTIPNLVIDKIKDLGKLSNGIAYYIGSAIKKYNITPNDIVLKIISDEIDINTLEDVSAKDANDALLPYVSDNLKKIKDNVKIRNKYFEKFKDKEGSLIYLIVATGNIYEDIVQAKAAAKQGADVIAVIRSTGQSLLDYVPYGATTEGYGGTYATQENFKLMRAALDEVGNEVGRYIRLCNYCSGLCMPEIAAMGAVERLDMMLNDALYGILFRDINMKRTFVDQYFSRVINSYADVIINTGEDNYLTTADAIEEAHTVLASQFLNEQLAIKAKLEQKNMGLGHAFEIDPNTENAFLYEIAQAQMSREIFPKAPLKYMPPTKFKTGNIFKSHVQDTLFNIVTTVTNQRVHLLGMLTEAIHTPYMMDRAISIESARYISTTMKDFSDEIRFKEDGIINNRANEVVSKATDLLKEMESIGLFESLSRGIFGGVTRKPEDGKGLDGVFKKSDVYINPILDRMLEEL